MSAWNGKYALLVRREFWEHRALLWVPGVAATMLLLVVIFGNGGPGAGFSGPGADFSMSVSPELIRSQMGMDGLARVGEMTLIATTVFLGVITGIMVLLYLLDSLYAERKDRSILFWKSLPVSDAETVLAKVFTGVVVMPLLTILLALVLQPLMAGILLLRYEMLRPFADASLMLGWIPALGRVLAGWAFVALWYLPVVGYLMLASVLSRRAPVGMAFLPLVVVSLVEGMLLDTRVIMPFLATQFAPWGRVMQPLFDPDGQWWLPFQNLRLWVGVLAGIAMLFAVVRFRRYRDDT